jgi:hypothetical protein
MKLKNLHAGVCKEINKLTYIVRQEHQSWPFSAILLLESRYVCTAKAMRTKLSNKIYHPCSFLGGNNTHVNKRVVGVCKAIKVFSENFYQDDDKRSPGTIK